MRKEERVMNWIKELFDFDDMNEVIIEDYDHLSYGKKITDCTNDYVIIYFDDERNKVNDLFKKTKPRS